GEAETAGQGGDEDRGKDLERATAGRLDQPGDGPRLVMLGAERGESPCERSVHARATARGEPPVRRWKNECVWITEIKAPPRHAREQPEVQQQTSRRSEKQAGGWQERRTPVTGPTAHGGVPCLRQLDGTPAPIVVTHAQVLEPPGRLGREDRPLPDEPNHDG